MPALATRECIASLEHETPFFLVSKDIIVERLRAFQTYFPGAVIHYAMKANSEPGVLRTLAEAGSCFEVASLGELELLKALSVPPDRIIYGSPVKPAAHIRAFFEYGVDRFAFDSLSELEKIAAIGPRSRVYIRKRVDDSGSVFRFSEKFGCEDDNVVPLLTRAQECGLQPYGISFHVGSQASNRLAWANAIEGLRSHVAELSAGGIQLEIINLGGGYPVAYPSNQDAIGLFEIAHSTRAALARLPYRIGLLLEPGRGVIADAAVLVTSIIGRVERRGTTWLFLDAGVYNALYEALAFQGSTRYRVTALGRCCHAPEMPFSLAGPTGDAPDVIVRDALLPRDLTVGDRLTFHGVGAYSVSIASNFNGFAKPAVFVI